VIGIVSGGTNRIPAATETYFPKGLSEAGFAVGQNVILEYRWAHGRYDQLPELVAELVRRQVAVLVATGGMQAALAAKAATATTPIVFAVGSDPVLFGLVASLNRPGGNITGVSLFTAALEGKRLGLLHELVPGASLIGFLVNPKNPNAVAQLKDVHDAGRALGRQIYILNADNDHDVDAVFQTATEQRCGALLVGSDPFFFSHREHIAMLAARHAIPAIYEWREFAEAGGLASYGTSQADAYRQAGLYAGRILKGAKPSDLPVMRPTKFELVINLKTAKALGLTIPPGVLAIVDEVIE
jgi:putative ABC transport system substrate-binding protein